MVVVDDGKEEDGGQAVDDVDVNVDHDGDLVASSSVEQNPMFTTGCATALGSGSSLEGGGSLEGYGNLEGDGDLESCALRRRGQGAMRPSPSPTSTTSALLGQVTLASTSERPRPFASASL